MSSARTIESSSFSSFASKGARKWHVEDKHSRVGLVIANESPTSSMSPTNQDGPKMKVKEVQIVWYELSQAQVQVYFLVPLQPLHLLHLFGIAKV